MKKFIKKNLTIEEDLIKCNDVYSRIIRSFESNCRIKNSLKLIQKRQAATFLAGVTAVFVIKWLVGFVGEIIHHNENFNFDSSVTNIITQIVKEIEYLDHKSTSNSVTISIITKLEMLEVSLSRHFQSIKYYKVEPDYSIIFPGFKPCEDLTDCETRYWTFEECRFNSNDHILTNIIITPILIKII